MELQFEIPKTNIEIRHFHYAQQGITLYPNPASGNAFLAVPALEYGDAFSFELFEVTGKRVIYFYRASDGAEINHRRTLAVRGN